jgi:hypothetical protein
MARSDGLTEADWLRAQNPGLMFDFVRERKVSPRRLRLATVGFCRLAWPFVPPLPHPLDAGCLALLDLAEQYADGLAKFTQMTAARRALAEPDVPRGGPSDAKVAAVWFASGRDPATGGIESAARLLGISWSGDKELEMPATRVRFGFLMREGGDWVAACRAMIAVVRDVFGNPFRAVPFDPNWRTTAAVGVARQMYESRDCSAMPILADALQDAGCADPNILDHCRGDSPHVRGCWVVDQVLRKE